MGPLGAYCPGHSHLRSAGRRQHHEDEEYQKHADHHGEEAHVQEYRRDDVARLVGRLEDVALDLNHPVRQEVGKQGGGILLDAFQSFAVEHVHHVVFHALPVEQANQPVAHLRPLQLLAQLNGVVLDAAGEIRLRCRQRVDYLLSPQQLPQTLLPLRGR